jgi:AraC family transcriptional regulator
MQLSLHPAEEVHTPVRCFHIEFRDLWEERLISPDGIHAEPHEFVNGYLPLLARNIHREFADFDDFSDMVLEGLALELIGFSCREKAAASSPGWIFQARELATDGFKGRLTLSAIAEILDVHPVHLAREFRRHFGHSIGQYVRDLRVQFVCRQLSETLMPLAEIAQNAGFADQSHMTRTFQRKTGQTPSQFRLVNGVKMNSHAS